MQFKMNTDKVDFEEDCMQLFSKKSFFVCLVKKWANCLQGTTDLSTTDTENPINLFLPRKKCGDIW